MDIPKYNQRAWDLLTEKDDVWTRPVTQVQIAAARNGDWQIVLTSNKPVPRDWFPDTLEGKSVLCLASGGGQQGPILAAAGAEVTVFDNSAKQLQQDEFVAQREGLKIVTVQGDMRDLSCFENDSFDLIVHPVSNLFVESVLPVWQEASRVLKPGGMLLSGFSNSFSFIFDLKDWEAGKLTPRHSIPYADTTDLPEDELKSLLLDQEVPLCFG